MVKKKGKSVSFDAMVKFFMNNYQIPTKRDLEAVIARLDRIERLVATVGAGRTRRSAKAKVDGRPATATASDAVMEIIRRYPEGIGFADIKLQAGYDEKKLRNILFRLHKSGKIKRKQRGIYQLT